jgi:tellurite resistance protein TerC
MFATAMLPLYEVWPFYVGFVLFVLFMLAVDLGLFHRDDHALSMKEAAGWSAFWFSLALMFGGGMWLWMDHSFASNARLLAVPGFDPSAAARELGIAYLTGLIVEKALAIDNLFVFLMVFSTFSIPAHLQHRVLALGIVGALVFRAIFVGLGAWLMQFHMVVMVFGALLVFTGFKIVFAEEKHTNLEDNRLLKAMRRVLPVTESLHGNAFIVRQAGRWAVTPLFMALAFIELSDILFAVDSVPAIFAITKEPFVVFTSNVFALLGLRSMYFLLANVADRFVYLKYGLGAVLIFVGLKMVWLNNAYGGKFPILWSLAFIGIAIGTSIAASLFATRRVTAPA